MAFSVDREPKILSSSRNPIPLVAVADPGWSTYQTYQIRCVVYKETGYRSDQEVELVTLPGLPAPDGKVSFNLQPVVEALVNHQVPNLATVGTLHMVSNQRYRFTLEEWIDGAKASETIYSDWHHVVLAGFGETMGQALHSWFLANKPLSWRPDPRKTLPWQPEIFSWIAPADGNAYLKGIAYRPNGTSVAWDQNNDSLKVKKYDQVSFRADWDALGVSDPASEFQYYELFGVVDIGGLFSTVKVEYHFDQVGCGPLDRFYVFENSLGGFDTVKTSGELANETNLKGQQAQVVLPVTAAPGTRQFVDYGGNRKELFEQHIGFQGMAEQLWLRELLASENAYRLGGFDPNLDGSGDLVPINIEKGTKDLVRDHGFPHPLKFKYSEAYIHQGL